jgi:hypothetical protein
MMKNPGYSKEEIDLLKAECEEEGNIFVLIEEDEDEDMDDDGDFAHFQFVGMHEGQEVIYDTIMSTLSFHHSSLLYEEAENKVKKVYKDFLAYEDRPADYKVNVEAEELMEEFIQEMEDEETIKVSEFVDKELDFDFGIGLEVALNIEEITFDDIEQFIEDFNSGKLKLDKTLYSFKNGFDED